MPKNARRLLIIIYVMSGGVEGVRVDLLGHAEEISRAFQMSEADFDRVWVTPARLIKEAKALDELE